MRAAIKLSVTNFFQTPTQRCVRVITALSPFCILVLNIDGEMLSHVRFCLSAFIFKDSNAKFIQECNVINGYLCCFETWYLCNTTHLVHTDTPVSNASKTSAKGQARTLLVGFCYLFLLTVCYYLFIECLFVPGWLAGRLCFVSSTLCAIPLLPTGDR